MPSLRPMAERDRDPGARWADFASAEPDLAAQVKERFGLARQHVLATLTVADAPRVSGTEVVWDSIADPLPENRRRHDTSDLWIAMTPDSGKAGDLRRDWRYAIHVNPGDQDMAHPDVKLAGTAHEVTDRGVKDAFAARHRRGQAFDLFRLHLRSVVRTTRGSDPLEATAWRPGLPVEVTISAS